MLAGLAATLPRPARPLWSVTPQQHNTPPVRATYSVWDLSVITDYWTLLQSRKWREVSVFAVVVFRHIRDQMCGGKVRLCFLSRSTDLLGYQFDYTTIQYKIATLICTTSTPLQPTAWLNQLFIERSLRTSTSGAAAVQRTRTRLSDRALEQPHCDKLFPPLLSKDNGRLIFLAVRFIVNIRLLGVLSTCILLL